MAPTKTEWFEIEVAFRFKPDEWIKTWRFAGGGKTEFDSLEDAQDHVETVVRTSLNSLYTDASYRYVRYTREVLDA